MSAAVFAAALVLTGCGDSESSADSSPATAPSSSAEPGAELSIQTAEPDVDDATESPDAGAGGRALPDGFPVAEIPIAAGTIIDGSRGDAGGPFAYTVLVQVPGTSPAAVMSGITGQLSRTGFEVAPGPATDKASIATFTSATYDVGVNVVRAEGKTIVTYVVVRKVS